MEKILIVILEACDFKSCEVHIRTKTKRNKKKFINCGKLKLDK